MAPSSFHLLGRVAVRDCRDQLELRGGRRHGCPQRQVPQEHAVSHEVERSGLCRATRCDTTKCQPKRERGTRGGGGKHKHTCKDRKNNARKKTGKKASTGKNRTIIRSADKSSLCVCKNGPANWNFDSGDAQHTARRPCSRSFAPQHTAHKHATGKSSDTEDCPRSHKRRQPLSRRCCAFRAELTDSYQRISAGSIILGVTKCVKST